VGKKSLKLSDTKDCLFIRRSFISGIVQGFWIMCLIPTMISPISDIEGERLDQIVQDGKKE
jgi:hypothetical protein